MVNANEFIPFDLQDCIDVIDKYGTGCLPWDKFWQFMAKQSKVGAPIEYIEQCYEILETVWKSKVK